MTTLTGLFIGEGTLLRQCALSFMARGHEVAGIVSADLPLALWAAERGLTHRVAIDPAELSGWSFDYLFSIVNMQMVRPEVLALARRGNVNFHDGPLPAYAGVHAPAWAIINGERQHGITWHEMTERADAGRIFRQTLFPIPHDATSLELNVRCYEAGLEAFDALLTDLEAGTLEPIVQNPRERSYFARHRRPPNGSVLQWHRPAEEISSLVRALDFGPYPNPLGAPKLWIGDTVVIPSRVRSLDSTSGASPGTVIDARPEIGELVVATATEDVVLDGFQTLDGLPLDIQAMCARIGIQPGVVLGTDDEAIQQLEAAVALGACHEAAWITRLGTLDPIDVPVSAFAAPRSKAAAVPLALPAGAQDRLALRDPRTRRAVVVAALGCALATLTRRRRFHIGYCDGELRAGVADVGGFFMQCVPVSVDLHTTPTFGAAADAVGAELEDARRRGLFLIDLLARSPTLEAFRGQGPALGLPVVVDEARPGQIERLADGVRVALVNEADGREWHWVFDRGMVSPDLLARLGAGIAAALEAILADPLQPLQAIPPSVAPEGRRVAVEPAAPSLQDAIEDQVARTPEATALVAGADRITYRDLNRRANRLARYLRSRGVGPDVLVGISLDRSIDLVVAVLAVLKAGGGYVPLDPAYPADRIRFMSGDAGLTLVITRSALAPRFAYVPETLALDTQALLFEAESEENLGPVGPSSRLAYVIYTSGSAGTPKGVMLEHRNVLSFFAAMNDCVPSPDGGVWLAVTSLSFDISVLELLWTLTRGFTVVVAPELGLRPAGPALAARPLDFSLFYFSADDGEPGNRYRLLMEGARFADTHGFTAVWTPERHFHAFGGLYPNPAVTGAAIAAITERVQIRAGSCVLPLHHPARVAEEWSVVDNISQGRVGLSVATGWQPNDFVLRPENFAARKEALLRDLDVVRRLWRGESVECAGPADTTVSVKTFPRPVQPELPVWLTAAGNPETFAAAGEAGAGVLTHLVGQTINELVDKIAVYRASREKAGHAGPGHVVLMLHTLVGDSDEQVREIVRKPLGDYLRTSINLIKPFASSFPTFRHLRDTGKSADEVFASLSEQDLDALVDHSVDRYVETGGLFGTPETCLRTIAQLKEAGVDEVACLIDFGVPTETVLAHLEHLDRLRQRANLTGDTAVPDTLPTLVARHGVTHLQCTPSMADMLLLESGATEAIGQLRALLVGGEALSASLARRLLQASPAALVNMYGPTETTVWSAAHQVTELGDVVPIGRAITGTELFVLDEALRPVRAGDAGELYIGGPGVARGYLNREALTRERFVPHPFSDTPDDRIYKTGDLVRSRPDGALEFLGRTDFQVKIRGHRIELGEIESALASHPEVREAVVVAREDGGDKRLVAYLVPAAGAVPAADDVRRHVARDLPEFMVPSHVVVLAAFPLTPNAKIDRRALPSPFLPAPPADASQPDDGSMAAQVARVWCDVLQVARVGAHQSFFDLGGHSLLAAQVLARLKHLDASLSLTDLFRYPTVATLAAHLTSGGTPAAVAPQATERAATRRAFMAKRQALRGPGTARESDGQ